MLTLIPEGKYNNFVWSFVVFDPVISSHADAVNLVKLLPHSGAPREKLSLAKNDGCRCTRIFPHRAANKSRDTSKKAGKGS